MGPTVATDDRGGYEIRNIPPGIYDIKVSATGFSTFEAKDISLQANNIARVDAPLKVGSLSEVVTVGAEIVQLQTDKTDIHTDISSAQLTQVTVGGYRNFQSMMDLMPGVMPSTFQNASTDSPARALTTNVNGTSRNSNNTRIDGAANVFTWLPHHAFYVPPIESIDTVNISTNNFDAEQGMAGGAAVSVITKSGTNGFHGVAFEYTSNHKWGAKNLFFNPNTPAGPGTPQRIDNQFGGTFGGPIKKDKLFFFTSWEGTTTAERGNRRVERSHGAGAGWQFRGLGHGLRSGDRQSGHRHGTATPFPDNVVPQARWSQAARTLQDMIPLPNTGTGQTNNYFASVPYYFKRDMVDGKLNWTPNTKTNVFGEVQRHAGAGNVERSAGLRRSARIRAARPARPASARATTHTDVFGGGSQLRHHADLAAGRQLRRHAHASRYDRAGLRQEHRPRCVEDSGNQRPRSSPERISRSSISAAIPRWAISTTGARWSATTGSTPMPRI